MDSTNHNPKEVTQILSLETIQLSITALETRYHYYYRQRKRLIKSEVNTPAILTKIDNLTHKTQQTLSAIHEHKNLLKEMGKLK